MTLHFLQTIYNVTSERVLKIALPTKMTPCKTLKFNILYRDENTSSHENLSDSKDFYKSVETPYE